MRSRFAKLCAALWLGYAGGAAGLAGQEPFVLDTLQVSVDSRLSSGVGSVQVLDAPALAALPVRSVAQALRWGLGVDLQPRSPAQADLSIRGSTFEQVLVLVDGVRMSDPQTGHFDLDLGIPLDRVERIEILRGPASAVYGSDALGGVVHIITKDGRNVSAASGVTRFEGGSNKSYSVAVDGTVPTGEWTVMGGISRDASDGHREGTDFRVTRASGRAVGPLGDGRVVVDGAYSERDFGADAFYAPFPSYEETRTTTSSLRWVGRAGGGLTVEPRVSFRRHEDDFILRREDPDFYRNLHDSRQLTTELQARTPVGPNGALAFGAEWSRESLESTNLGDREQDRRAVYGEIVLRDGAFQLQGGVRFDDRDDVGSFTSPSVSMRWTSPEGIRLRGAWGRTFRAPTWTERYYVDPANVGTPDLAVERGWSAEAGIEYQHPRALLSVTAFQRETEDLIDWARPVGAGDEAPWETRNVEEARHRGIEVAVEGLSYEGMRLRGTAAWLKLDAREAEGFFSKSSLRPIHREITIQATVPLPDQAVLTVLTADRARLQGGGGLTADLRLELPVAGASWYVDALNVTDESYADVTGFPIPGRSFMLGVRTPFGG